MTVAARQPLPLPRLASKPVWSFCNDGSVMDLAAPDQSFVCFQEMALTLSGLRRFNGRGISIAQHSVMGAQAILNEGGTSLEAALFLLHDGHEWALGDITRPMEDLLVGLLPTLAIREAIQRAKAGWDGAIYAAARLPLPEFWTAHQRKLIKSMDDRICRAEAIALFGSRSASQFPASQPPKTTGAIRLWGAAKAEEAFSEMARSLIGFENIVSQAAVAAAARALRA
nr:HD family hydrolase [Rhizobium sp. Q54]